MIEPDQIKQARQRIGATQQELAEQAGVSQSLIAKLEAGRIEPKYSTMKKISQTIRELQHPHEMTLGDIMTYPIMTAAPDQNVPSILRIMRKNWLSQMPIMHERNPVGLITEGTLLETIEQGTDLTTLCAADVMDDPPPMLPANTPIKATIQLLEHTPILLVKEGKRTGIVAKTDILASTI